MSDLSKSAILSAPELAPNSNKKMRACLYLRVAVFLTVALLFGHRAATAQVDVLTQHNDIARTGLNSNETYLNAANVNPTLFGKLFSQNVDGYVIGQPLVASGVLMNDGKVHNVVYVATQHNSVYAFDADSNLGSNAAPLWTVSLNDGGTSDPIADYGCTGTHYTEIGIMGTPVIDPGKTTLYVVAKTVQTVNGNTVRNFSLHALDIRTGNELLGGPVIIAGSVPSNSGTIQFDATFHMQRPALLLTNGTVYVAFAGNGCDQYAYHGWLFAYDAQSLQQLAVFNTAPNGREAGIWQGGSGPAADANGSVYIVTANGTYDGVTASDYGDTVLQLGWNGSTFGIKDSFTPYNQKQMAQLDLDLGSSGVLLLPDQPGLYPHEMVTGGKEGTLYLINRDNQGGYNPTTDNVIQSIPKAVVSELVGVSSYWNGSVYVAGDLDYIKQFGLVNGMLTSAPVSQTAMAFGGAGPSSTSVTANGNANGILWAVRHTNAALFAFDATNLASELYDSNKALNYRDKLPAVMRFVTPTISNGKVFVGTTTTLTAYGLLPALAVGAGNNQSGVVKTVLPVGLQVLATDAYVANPIPGVAVTCKDGGVGGTFSPSSTQTTDATGAVTLSYKLPAKPRTITITCTSPGYVNAAFTETSTTGPPVKMTLTAGNNQIAAVNTPLPEPLVVKVVDANGLAVGGVTVNFTDNGAGGILSPSSAVTAANGTATTSYTTGPNSGTVAITASTTGLNSVKFKETVQ